MAELNQSHDMEKNDFLLLMSSTKRATNFGSKITQLQALSQSKTGVLEEANIDPNMVAINPEKNKNIPKVVTDPEGNEPSPIKEPNNTNLRRYSQAEPKGNTQLDTTVLSNKDKSDPGRGCTTANTVGLITLPPENNKLKPTESCIKPQRKPKNSRKARSTIKYSEYTDSGSYTVKPETMKKKKRKKKRRKKKNSPTKRSESVTDSHINSLLAVHHESISTKRAAQSSKLDRLGMRTSLVVPDKIEDTEKLPPPSPRVKLPFENKASIFEFMAQNSARNVRQPLMRDPLPSAATFVPPDIGRDSRADAFRPPTAVNNEPLRQVQLTGKIRFRKKIVKKNL